MKIQFKKTFLLTAVLLFSVSLYSQNTTDARLELNPRTPGSSLIIDNKIGYRPANTIPQRSMLLNPIAPKKEFSSVDINIQQQKKKKKSVGLGILLSALLPGAGEFYGESYLKAGIFFAAEVLAWGTLFYFNGKGDAKTEEFQAYADKYWDVRTYARWLKNGPFRDNGQINPDEPDKNVLREQIIVCERVNFSHTMPEYGSQQFYELIGKYQNFQPGWTNLHNVPTYDPGSPYYYQNYHDPVFTAYAVERDEANDFYKYAKVGPIVAIINHILSAADAAWVISDYNKKITLQTGFRMQNRISPYTYKIKQIPTFNVSLNF
jgi:hypothetical protein